MAACGATLGTTLRRMAGVSAAVSLFGLANGGNFAVVAVNMANSGASDTLVGLATSAYFVGALGASLTLGPVVARIGHVGAFAAAAALAAVSTAGLFAIESVFFWPLLRCLTGFAMGGYYLVVDSWFNNAASNATRGRTLAFYETVRLLSVAMGSYLLLSLGAWSGTGVFLMTGVFYAIAIVPVAASHAVKPDIPALARWSWHGLLATAPLGFAFSLAGGLTTASIYGLMPLYGKQIGLDTALLATLIFAAHAGALFLQGPVGLAGDRWGRLPIMAAVTLAGATVALVLGLGGGDSFMFALMGTAIIGGVSHTINTMGVVLANDRVDPASFVAVAAALLVAYDIGTVVGPPIAALTMEMAGPGGLFLFLGAVLLLLALLATAQTRRGAARVT
jgi:MFS family permease